MHHNYVLTIRSGSYRLRTNQKSGLIEVPAADAVCSAPPLSITFAAEQICNQHHEPENAGGSP
ncbi:hypothetical protein BEL01nite_57420 [Bradyrhizobium elkanii]|nr:hypothetical protein BEL01nite_57420 [Bradyrhizobium elkanii]